MSVAGALFMINNLQVHWQDGMLLTAKHFELLQNYLQQLSCSQLKIVNPYYWGISKFKIKTEELRNGKLCIDEIRGIFPDGSPFDITQNNTPQLELKFTSKVENQAIFIYFKPEEYNSLRKIVLTLTVSKLLSSKTSLIMMALFLTNTTSLLY